MRVRGRPGRRRVGVCPGKRLSGKTRACRCACVTGQWSKTAMNAQTMGFLRISECSWPCHRGYEHSTVRSGDEAKGKVLIERPVAGLVVRSGVNNATGEATCKQNFAALFTTLKINPKAGFMVRNSYERKAAENGWCRNASASRCYCTFASVPSCCCCGCCRDFRAVENLLPFCAWSCRPYPFCRSEGHLLLPW